ncbi:MAG: hypothetical protein IPL89_16110 [Acidobacteria bacterium]|nr:hypothetical protein [Acidobacteriota bacterium]
MTTGVGGDATLRADGEDFADLALRVRRLAGVRAPDTTPSPFLGTTWKRPSSSARFPAKARVPRRRRNRDGARRSLAEEPADPLHALVHRRRRRRRRARRPGLLSTLSDRSVVRRAGPRRSAPRPPAALRLVPTVSTCGAGSSARRVPVVRGRRFDFARLLVIATRPTRSTSPVRSSQDGVQGI